MEDLFIMNKKVSLASLILACGIIATGCGDDNTENTNEPAENNVEQTQTENKENSDINLASILEQIKAAYGEDYLPNTPLDEEMVKQTFNLDLELVEEFVAEMPMIGFHPDKVLIVKAKEGKIDDVVAQLEAARTELIENSMTYPANIEKIQSTKVVSNDNYAAFLLVGSSENMLEDEEERLKFAEDEVQKAVTAFDSMFN